MTGPNLILAAAPRSGSTQLCRWLDSHPDIGLCPIKETNHFSAHEFDPDYVKASHLNDCDPNHLPKRPVQFAVVREPASYAALFQQLPQLWRVDGSTSYLSCPEAPGLIRAAQPKARVIVLTRDPVKRALSHYGLALRTGRTRAPLEDELLAEQLGNMPLAAHYILRPSRQQAGVERFRQCFGDDHLLHLRFEEMVHDPARALTQIARFLQIDPAGFNLSMLGRNQTALPRFPRLNQALLASGVKTWLRQVLPAEVKPMLKSMWLAQGAKPAIAPAALRALETALGGEP